MAPAAQAGEAMRSSTRVKVPDTAKKSALAELAAKKARADKARSKKRCARPHTCALNPKNPDFQSCVFWQGVVSMLNALLYMSFVVITGGSPFLLQAQAHSHGYSCGSSTFPRPGGRQQRAGEDAWSDEEEAQLSESDSEPGAGRGGARDAAAEPLDDEERDGGDRLGYGNRDGRYERGYDEDDEDARLVGVRLPAAVALHAPPAARDISWKRVAEPPNSLTDLK